MTTLYRKHRPQSFADIVGQNHIKMTLQYEIASDMLAHAYLFCGPRGIGKTTLARVIARAVNCTERKQGGHEPCNSCESCRTIREARSVDIIEIDAASHTGVDNVRENIIAAARIAPVQSRRKVFIIDEVHMLSVSAFNALLKILEEPPSYVIFILCTTEAHKVPATIISRCQRFDFKKIPAADMIARLERIVQEEGLSAEREVLAEVARQSEGHMRDAESILGQIAAISSGQITVKEASLVIPRSNLGETAAFLGAIARKDAAAAIKLVNTLAEDGLDLKIFASNLIEAARKLLLARLSPELSLRFSRDWGEGAEDKLAGLNNLMDVPALQKVITELSIARDEIKSSFIIQMPLEMAAVRLCSIQARPASAAPSPSPSMPVAGSLTVEPAGPGGASLAEDGSRSLELKVVTEKWSEVLSRVLKYNHSLSFILKVCEPRGLSGNQLCLAFKYKFHKDRLDNPEIKKMVEQALFEVFEKPFDVQAVVDDSIDLESGHNSPAGPVAQDGGENNEIINDILKTFGGKVVG